MRVETVNGAPAEPAEERPWFGELTPVFPTQKLPAPKALKDTPFGRGSRVAIAGPPGAGASRLLREIAQALAGDGSSASTSCSRAPCPRRSPSGSAATAGAVAGGGFDRSADEQAQGAEMAIERAKRRVERGGDAVVVIDSLDALPPAPAGRVRRGRATEEGGSLTVVATGRRARAAARGDHARGARRGGGSGPATTT